MKWLNGPFDRRDMAELARVAPLVPGAESDATKLAVVSLSGTASDVDAGAIDLVWGPEELLEAWR